MTDTKDDTGRDLWHTPSDEKDIGKLAIAEMKFKYPWLVEPKKGKRA